MSAPRGPNPLRPKSPATDTARFEAEGLAGDLPAVLLEARRLAGAAPGVHGRRRAGLGEAFWQFRDHRPEDGARLVDWRRSARGERLYVREREREAAQTALFWIDPDPGFGWASGPGWPTKRRRAMTIGLAFALLVTRGGERAGALGGPPPRAGGRAVDRLAEDLAGLNVADPPPPLLRSAALYFSDFYGPLDPWRARLKAAAAAGAGGALVMVSDPAEEDFPYEGRTLFEAPGRRETVLFGRAQSARAAYAERLAAQRAAVRAIAAQYGFVALLHRTDRSPAPTLAALCAALGEHR
ncbi:MAG: DUF58 domain-containing protein [Alphaproteobacteria bacterium]|nr:DUF58 domain-containing protein [Alphaproteobacteria bacterium]